MEDRATRGRDPSADPGAKTGAGGRMPPLGIPGLAPTRSIHRQSSNSHDLTTLPERSAHATSPTSRELVHPPLHAGSLLETVRSADRPLPRPIRPNNRRGWNPSFRTPT